MQNLQNQNLQIEQIFPDEDLVIAQQILRATDFFILWTTEDFQQYLRVVEGLNTGAQYTRIYTLIGDNFETIQRAARETLAGVARAFREEGNERQMRAIRTRIERIL
jgi:hypothetical protein